MASTKSDFYNNARKALQLMIDERRKQAPPSYEMLSSVMSVCKDEQFRRKLGIIFQGPKASGMQAICDMAVQIPWVAP